MSLQKYPPQDFSFLQKELHKFLNPKMIISSIHCIRCKNAIWIHSPRKNKHVLDLCIAKKDKGKCEYHPYQNWYIDRKWSNASINYRKLLNSKQKNKGTWKYENNEEKTKMKGNLVEAVVVPDGLHKGSILDENLKEVVLPNGKITQYLDFKVSVDDFKEVESLKFGVPWYETPNELSALGVLLQNLGVDLGEFDTSIDIIGKKIQYLTNTDKNGYAKIIIKSIKPLE